MLQLDERTGGRRLWRLCPEWEPLMLVPDEIRKCVVFVGYQGVGGMRWVGTAFFVLKTECDNELGFMYLVTAKHLVDGIKKKSSDGKVYLRVNTKNGGIQIVTTEIDTWFSIESETTAKDVSAMYAGFKNDFDYLGITADMAATESVRKEKTIGAGDEVFITGLFVNQRGQRRNIPIVRIGNIAALPEEPVGTALGAMEAYLIEARSIGGLSGSPVFVRPHPQIPPNQLLMSVPSAPIYWLGLIHGHYDLHDSQNDMVVPDELNAERINMGIAIVVPVESILDVLHHQEFVKFRQRMEGAYRKSRLPTPDSLSEDSFTKDDFSAALKKVSARRDEPDEGTS